MNVRNKYRILQASSRQIFIRNQNVQSKFGSRSYLSVFTFSFVRLAFLLHINCTLCTETHFTTQTDEAPFIAGTNFELFTVNRRSHGGGVAVAVRKTMKYEQINYIPTSNMEVIILKNTSTVLAVVYWPPTDIRTTLPLDTLLDFTHQFTDTHHLIIAGDFNLRGVSWSANYEESPFLIPSTESARPFERDTILSFESRNLYQVVDQPNSNQHFLDLIFTNLPHKLEATPMDETHDILRPTKHHSPVLCSTITLEQKEDEQFYTRRITNHEQLSKLLDEIPISFLPTRETISNIVNEVVNAFHQATIVKKFKLKPYLAKHPWLKGSSRYQQLRKEMQHLQRSGDQPAVKLKRAEIHKLYNDLKEEYCEQRIATNGNPNDMYNLVKFYRSANELPATMTYHGAPIQDQIISMTDHLSKVFADRTEPLYEGDYDANIRQTWEQTFVPNDDYIQVGNFQEADVYQELLQLDKKKDPGNLMMSCGKTTSAHMQRGWQQY